MDNAFLLQDRIQKIRQIIGKYGEENFYISFSGGKDSTVLSFLIDMAIPTNRIPRVYANTGIELNMIRDFVLELQKADDRIVIIKPSTPIKPMLERDGYPFKSKTHAHHWERYNRIGMCKSILQYLGERTDKEPWSGYNSCPEKLKYQFTKEFTAFKISDKCCVNLKEKPLQEYAKKSGKKYGINGVMKDEGGRRVNSVCLVMRDNKLSMFQPLSPITKEWEDWFIQTYNIKICDIYYPPYNFERTGCKGCPFARYLQNELDTLESFFPEESRQAEFIWQPVYQEYRRLGYRLKQKKKTVSDPQMTIMDYMEQTNDKEDK